MNKLNLNSEDIPCTYVYDKKFNEAHLLYHHCLVNNIDLIFIGSKIKSELANIVLDRTSEDLADAEKNMNVLIVKDRKQTLGFLEAIFKLSCIYLISGTPVLVLATFLIRPFSSYSSLSTHTLRRYGPPLGKPAS